MVKYESKDIFEALGHDVRVQMVRTLAKGGKMAASELAAPFEMSLPAAMKHIHILEDSGVIVTSKEGRVRYCALNTEALAEGMSWFLATERLWESRLCRLEDHLRTHLEINRHSKPQNF